MRLLVPRALARVAFLATLGFAPAVGMAQQAKPGGARHSPPPSPLAAPTAGTGKGYFAGSIVYANYPTGVALGDIDNDGHPDLVASNDRSDAYSVALGTGTGTFAEPTEFSMAAYSEPVAVVLVDLNADGNLDVLLANSGTDNVSVGLNNGSGGFTFGTPVSVGTTPVDLVTGDFNGDGSPDFATVNSFASTLSVRLNTGTGTFTAPTDLAVGNEPTALRVGDFNQDGTLELAVASKMANTVQIYHPTGMGIFTLGQTLAAPGGPTALAVGRVTAGGGGADLVVASANAVRVFHNNGAGVFTLAQTAANLGGTVRDMQLVDLDSDLDADLLLATDNRLQTALNAGGTFAPNLLRSLKTGYDEPQKIAVADIDGDLDPDVVFSDGSYQLFVRLNLAALPSVTIAAAEELPGGVYQNVTVANGGVARAQGEIVVAGTLAVQAGGELDTNYKVISGPGSLTVAADATMRVEDDLGLPVTGAPNGRLNLSGTFSFAGDATYIYQGGNQQTGPGLPATVRNVENLAQTLTLSQPLTVTRTLLLNGYTDMVLGNHNLTLHSDAQGTAMVLQPLGDGGVGRFDFSGGGTGRVVQQRSIEPVGTYRGPGYRHYSSPMQAAPVSDLAVPGLFTPLVDPAFNALPTPLFPPAQFPNVYSYEQDRLTAPYPAFSSGWYSPANLAETLEPGRGYTVRIAAGAKVDLVGKPNDDFFLDVPLHTGPQAEQGWNFLGNPFLSPLDITQFGGDPFGFSPGATSGDVDQSLSVFYPTSQFGGIYRTSTFAGVGTLPTAELATMQGFFVHANGPDATGTPNFNFSVFQRVQEYRDPVFARPRPTPAAQVRLTLTGPDATIGTDETLVYFQATATDGAFDRTADARKIFSTGLVPSIFTRLAATGEPLALNALPLPSAVPLQVALDLVLGQPGSQTLACPELPNLPPSHSVWLEDRLLHLTQELAVAPRYTFSAAAGPLNGRFVLHIASRLPGPLATAAAQAAPVLALYPNPATAAVQVAGAPVGVAITVTDALGRPARTPAVVAANGTATLDLTGLAAGVYVVRAGTRAQRLVVR